MPETALDGRPEDTEVVPATIQERGRRETAIDRVSDDKVQGRGGRGGIEGVGR